MIDKIELTIVKDGIVHTMRPMSQPQDEDWAFDSMAMFCKAIRECGINTDYAFDVLKGLKNGRSDE